MAHPHTLNTTNRPQWRVECTNRQGRNQFSCQEVRVQISGGTELVGFVLGNPHASRLHVTPILPLSHPQRIDPLPPIGGQREWLNLAFSKSFSPLQVY